MRNLDRIAVLAGLVVLLVVVFSVLPRVDLFAGLRHVADALPWVLIPLFFILFGGRCCGRRCAPRTDVDPGPA